MSVVDDAGDIDLPADAANIDGREHILRIVYSDDAAWNAETHGRVLSWGVSWGLSWGLAVSRSRAAPIAAWPSEGICGYQLACDATNAETVGRLRRLKRREQKPFALMARDLDVIRRYCAISPEEERQLTAAQAPIVLLSAKSPQQLPEAVAPGLDTLGFMLPTTPLHVLLLQEMEVPVVMTSGNISEEPPIVDDAEAREKLAGVAAFALVHDREIANRVDDSVVRVMAEKSRVLRRARGYAPLVSPKTAIRARRPPFSASSSMDSVSATTAPCGAANSCWRIISGFGGWRGCGRSPCRAGRRPCANRGEAFMRISRQRSAERG